MHRMFPATFICFWMAAFCCGLSIEASAQAFTLFGKVWQPAVIQKTTEGWQHVYFCQECRLTPSLAIISSTNATPDTSLHSELDRAYDKINIESGLFWGQQQFTVIKASEPLSAASPKRVTAVITRYKSLRPNLWHHAQALIETDSEDKERVAQNLWLNLLGNASLDRHHLTLFPQDTSVVVDISSPDRSWFSDFIEDVGVEKLILGTTVTTTGLLLLGAQVALGAANVKGPCGKPIGQCPCTKKALKAAGLPAI